MKKNPVTGSGTVSHKDPITAVDGVHDDDKDVKDTNQRSTQREWIKLKLTGK